MDLTCHIKAAQWTIADGLGVTPKCVLETCHHNFGPPCFAVEALLPVPEVQQLVESQINKDTLRLFSDPLRGMNLTSTDQGHYYLTFGDLNTNRQFVKEKGSKRKSLLGK